MRFLKLVSILSFVLTAILTAVPAGANIPTTVIVNPEARSSYCRDFDCRDPEFIVVTPAKPKPVDLGEFCRQFTCESVAPSVIGGGAHRVQPEAPVVSFEEMEEKLLAPMSPKERLDWASDHAKRMRCVNRYEESLGLQGPMCAGSAPKKEMK